MGTRNLTAVMIDGQYKVAQYCQWDGYPSGQGMTILQFLQTEDLDKFRDQVKMCREITPEEHKNYWTECGADPDSEFVGMDVSDKFKAKHPYLHRDCGGDVLTHIQNSKEGLALSLDIEFAGDSLFCEWAYVIDLDKGTFEVYKGFNQEPLDKSERFAGLTAQLDKEGKYYQVKLLHSWNLDDLPSEDDFLSTLEPPEEEEDEVQSGDSEPAVDVLDKPDSRKVDWE